MCLNEFILIELFCIKKIVKKYNCNYKWVFFFGCRWIDSNGEGCGAWNQKLEINSKNSYISEIIWKRDKKKKILIVNELYKLIWNFHWSVGFWKSKPPILHILINTILRATHLNLMDGVPFKPWARGKHQLSNSFLDIHFKDLRFTKSKD